MIGTPCEMHAYERHAYERHALGMSMRDIPCERHTYERHTYERHAQKGHAYENAHPVK